METNKKILIIKGTARMDKSFKNTQPKNYNVLSILRVLACFLTVRGHYFDRFDLPALAGKGFTTGAGPVVVFFVISGFLAYDGYTNNPNTMNYYRRRLLRIIPPYYIILICCVIVDNFIPLTTLPMGKGNWLRYFTFSNMIIPSFSFNDYNDLFGFWTMGCFPIFYLCTPVFSKWITSLKKAIGVVVASMVVNLGQRVFIEGIFGYFGFNQIERFANCNPLGTLYLFLFGMAAAYAYRNSEEIKMAVAFAVIFLTVLMMQKNGYIMWGLASAIICLSPSIHMPDRMKNNIVWKWGWTILKFLDENSFNIYLLHLLVREVEINLSGTNGTRDCIICIFVTLIISELLRKITNMLVLRSGKEK